MNFKFHFLIIPFLIFINTAYGSDRTLCPPASKLISLTYTELYSPAAHKHENVSVEYFFDNQDTFQGTLIISPSDPNSSLKPYIFYPEVGQQFFMTAYPIWFGDLYNLLCVEWTYGASSIGLALYHINKLGHITCLFEEASRFGVKILHLEGYPSHIPQIVVAEGLLFDDAKTTKIYNYSPDKNTFVLTDTISVEHPHTYKIATTH